MERDGWKALAQLFWNELQWIQSKPNPVQGQQLINDFGKGCIALEEKN